MGKNHSYRGKYSTFSYFTHSSNIFKAGHRAGYGDTMINEKDGSVPQGPCSLERQTGKRTGRCDTACIGCSYRVDRGGQGSTRERRQPSRGQGYLPDKEMLKLGSEE